MEAELVALSYMKLKAWLLQHGLSKQHVDACPDKHTLMHLWRTTPQHQLQPRTLQQQQQQPRTSEPKAVARESRTRPRSPACKVAVSAGGKQSGASDHKLRLELDQVLAALTAATEHAVQLLSMPCSC